MRIGLSAAVALESETYFQMARKGAGARPIAGPDSITMKPARHNLEKSFRSYRTTV